MKKILIATFALLIPSASLMTGCKDEEYGNSVSVTAPGVAVDASATSAIIELKANCPWSSSVDYSSGSGWCELTPSSGNGTTTIQVTLTPSTESANRSATVTFRAQDELGQKATFVVTQRGTAFYFEFDGTVNDGIFEIPQAAGGHSFSFTAGTAWTAVKGGTDNGWLTLAETSGTSGEVVFAMTATANPDVRPRSVDITFTSTDNPNNTAVVTVKQLISLQGTTASVANGEELAVSWTALGNAVSYEVVVKNASTQAVIATVEEIPASQTSLDLLDNGIDYGTYIGEISVEVKTYFDSDDPEIYSYSDPVTTHNLFADGSGDGTVGSEYHIAAARHFINIGLAKTAHYKQVADIDFTGVEEYVSIGNGDSPFRGSYTAAKGASDNYKLKNLDIVTTTTTSSGMFGYLGADGTITRVDIDNCSLSLGSLAQAARGNGHALLVGVNLGKVSYVNLTNCNVTGSTEANNKFIIGGVVGTNNGGQVSYCTATGGKMIISGKSTAGAIVGLSGSKAFTDWASETTTVTFCRNYSMEIDGSRMPTSDGSSGVGAIGGVVGGSEGVMENCINNAHVHGSYYSGGVLGTSSYDRTVGFQGSKFKVSKCYNTGKVEGRWAGGIIAALVQNNTAYQGTTVVEECFNTGEVSSNFDGSASTSENHVGGIVARNYGVIRNCYNTGAIDGNGKSNTGGICGDAYKANGGIYSSYTTGAVTAGSDVNTGAVVGFIAAANTKVEVIYLNTSYSVGAGSNKAANVADASKLVSKTDAEMETAATYSGWDTNVWNISDGSHPTLKNNQLQQ